jgi:hypothetical protein
MGFDKLPVPSSRRILFGEGSGGVGDKDRGSLMKEARTVANVDTFVDSLSLDPLKGEVGVDFDLCRHEKRSVTAELSLPGPRWPQTSLPRGLRSSLSIGIS